MFCAKFGWNINWSSDSAEDENEKSLQTDGQTAAQVSENNIKAKHLRHILPQGENPQQAFNQN